VTTRKTRGPARAQGTRRARRQASGYPSDLTDAQWQIIAPHLPPERPGRRGRPRIWPRRRIIEAILYLDRTGCAWRYLPADFPPWQTVYGYFAAWRDDGTLARLHDVLRAQVRTAAGRKPQPTAAVIDSQSVRAADTVPKATRGWDAAKKTSDAFKVSSCFGVCRRRGRGEGGLFVVGLAGGQAVVQAAEEPAEEVALGGGVPVAVVSAPVVVGAGAG
jgi:transposase